MKCDGCNKTKPANTMARWGNSKPFRYTCKECFFKFVWR